MRKAWLMLPLCVLVFVKVSSGENMVQQMGRVQLYTSCGKVCVNVLLIYLQLNFAVCILAAQVHCQHSTPPLLGAITVRKLDRSCHAARIFLLVHTYYSVVMATRVAMTTRWSTALPLKR